MPRKTLIRSSRFPYHVTARVNNKEAFPLPLDRAWDVLTRLCWEIGVLYGARVHALVLMGNHFHLLITVPSEDLGVVMKHFQSSGTRTMNLVSGHLNRIFGARYHWSLINSPLYFAHALKYVYRNPVKAGICERVEEYPFSTLSGQLGFSKLSIPLCYPVLDQLLTFIPEDAEDLLEWLNRPYRKEHSESIRKALHKCQFKIPKMGKKTKSNLELRRV
ncbi:MAG: transposase [Bdellovibrionota bacterium]